jgi:hypothetical protein
MSQTHALAAELLAGADELPWHGTQLAPSNAEYLPTPQSIQMLELVAPAAAEAVPPAHWVHAPEPVVPLYFPATHAVHFALAAAEAVPAAHWIHTPEPVVPLYFPAAHALQFAPL